MRRPFIAIILLITVSLTGIMLFQVSRLQDMALLKREQVKDRIRRACNMASDDLMQNVSSGTFALTPSEISEKIAGAFRNAKLEDMSFEFSLKPVMYAAGEAARQTINFDEAMKDSINNYTRANLLVTMGGPTAAKPFVYGSVIIVALNYKGFAAQSLRFNIAVTILFAIIVTLAFFLMVRTMIRQAKQAKINMDQVKTMVQDLEKPIATISLAADAIKHEKVLQDKDKISYFSQIIKEENQKMQRRKLF